MQSEILDEEDILGALCSGGAIFFDCVNLPGIDKNSKYYYKCEMNMDPLTKFEHNNAYTSGGAIQISGEYNNAQNRRVTDLLKDQIFINNSA